MVHSVTSCLIPFSASPSPENTTKMDETAISPSDEVMQSEHEVMQSEHEVSPPPKEERGVSIF